MEQNPVDQAASQHYQSFSLDSFQPPSPLELPVKPVDPIIIMSYINPAPQNSAHAKEYGLGKPTPSVATEQRSRHSYKNVLFTLTCMKKYT